MTTNKTIFIIDDEQDDAFLTKRALQKKSAYPLDIHIFSSGEDLLRYLQAQPDDTKAASDLIILDINMPVMSGFDVLRHLRADSRTKFTPVVMLSSSSEQIDIRKSYEGGANSYIQKPVNYSQFSDIAALVNQYWLHINLSPKFH
ncbi:MAG: response regulator [Balneolia bacterium]|nr:response regulator [Balneolia bacterium]